MSVSATHAAALAACLFPLAPVAGLQAGDREGEPQPALPSELVVPAAPVLSPSEALAAFEVAPGLRVELVACEPLVEDPVAIAFGSDGELWVCEMRGFMPDADGTGELEPVGAIAVLTDSSGDGVMDQRRVFLDDLVLPRGVAPALDGALVLAPPDLLFCRDTDGDGAADERAVVDTGFSAALANPEHAINGLVFGHDGRYHCANHSRAYFHDGSAWISEPTSGGGQWGLAKDDVGRFYYNTNSDALRGDRVSSRYGVRNPNHGRIAGINTRYVDDQRVYPIRITPGVNRGYRADTLGPDWKLVRYTGACGPGIFRGTRLPSSWLGDAFVCEPTANLVKRYVFEGRGPARMAVPAWPERELLASTDERFRPVNIANGPDGALYVVDLYRGILQHRVFLTSFLRKQAEQRGLDGPAGLGRIYRIVADDSVPSPPAALSTASWTELAALLGHPNGWLRDTAQRLFVEEGRGDPNAIDLLHVAAGSAEPLARLHALWALATLEAFDEELWLARLADPDPRVVRAALETCEQRLASNASRLTPELVRIAREGDAQTRQQALLSLGAGRQALTEAALAALLSEDASTGESRSAVLSGLAHRELEFLDRLDGWTEPAPGRDTFLRLLARAVGRERVAERVSSLVERALAEPIPWRGEALMLGLCDVRPMGPTGEPGYIQLEREPERASALRARAEAGEPACATLLAGLAWPGRSDLPAAAVVRALTPDEQARFASGALLYTQICAACHLSSGRGEPGKAPPLRASPWVLGSEERLGRIVLQGLSGPIELDGERWDGEMPAWSASDEELAAVLTYIRREWGHGASPFDAQRIAELRAGLPDRARPWTVSELEALR